MKEYTKIYPPFTRYTEGPQKNKLCQGSYFSPEVSTLATLLWHWTEKIDGTNTRIHWDGHRVRFGGRTADAQVPVKLLDFLQDSFPEELFEQTFFGKPVTLYGEGCGAGIQSGGKYFTSANFLLFDVFITDADHPMGGWWLEWDNIKDVATNLGISIVPEVGWFTIPEAVLLVEDGLLSSYGEFAAEGIVGKAPHGIFTRRGERLMTKVKVKDF